MLKSNVGFVGVGQCGNNIASIMERKYEYYALMVNTSKEDLEAVRPLHSFHLDGGKGLAKEPEKVMNLLKKNDNVNKLGEALSKHMREFEIVFVIFSSGGGTGSALGSMICKLLVSQGKIVCPVVVIPNEKQESNKVSNNTLRCLKSVSSLNGIGSIFALDNKKKEDKFVINTEFADVLNQYLSRENNSSKGNIDESEFEKLLSVKGFGILTKVSKDRTNTGNLIETLRNNIYADVDDMQCSYLGICVAQGKSIDKETIMSEIDVAIDDFMGYGGNSTIMMISGLPFPKSRVEKYKEKIESRKESILKVKEKDRYMANDTIDVLDDLFNFAEEEDLFSDTTKEAKEEKEENGTKDYWSTMIGDIGL